MHSDPGGWVGSKLRADSFGLEGQRSGILCRGNIRAVQEKDRNTGRFNRAHHDYASFTSHPSR